MRKIPFFSKAALKRWTSGSEGENEMRTECLRRVFSWEFGLLSFFGDEQLCLLLLLLLFILASSFILLANNAM